MLAIATVKARANTAASAAKKANKAMPKGDVSEASLSYSKHTDSAGLRYAKHDRTRLGYNQKQL